MNINLEGTIPGTQNFKWKEALHLDSVKMFVFPYNIDAYHNLLETAAVMQKIRDIFGEPIRVTSWYRPEMYNKAIGGAKKSYHVKGLACDFKVKGMRCSTAKRVLKKHLEDLNIRLEDNGTGNWLHIDLGKPGKSGRFFKP